MDSSKRLIPDHELLQLCTSRAVFSMLVAVRLCTVVLEMCRWLTGEGRRGTDICLTDKGWRNYGAMDQNWSYQPTFAGRAVVSLGL